MPVFCIRMIAMCWPAAIRCNANVIVTFNLKDFPDASLRQYDIEVIHPDDFILYQIDMAPTVCCRAFQAQRSALKNPSLSVDTFLATLQIGRASCRERV